MRSSMRDAELVCQRSVRRKRRFKDSLWRLTLVMGMAHISLTEGFLHRLKFRRKAQDIHERPNILTSSTENKRFPKSEKERHADNLQNPSATSDINGPTSPTRREGINGFHYIEEEHNRNGINRLHKMTSCDDSSETRRSIEDSPASKSVLYHEPSFSSSNKIDDTVQTNQSKHRQSKDSKPSAELNQSDVHVGSTQTAYGRPTNNASKTESSILRDMWRSRHARTAEEGIRNEKTSQLSSVLAKAEGEMNGSGREYAARTITGLINALAEEVLDLKVEVKTQPDSPFWRKQIDAIKIDFSRLAFKPLKLGGSVATVDPTPTVVSNAENGSNSSLSSNLFSDLSCIDQVFDQIDADKSGALDSDEIAQALNLATLVSAKDQVKHVDVIKNLASDLVKLYDFNGDGVVDRYEYRSMVEDMAALRQSREIVTEEENMVPTEVKEGFVSAAKRITGDFIGRLVWRLGIAGKKDAPVDEDNIMLKETVRDSENSTETNLEIDRDREITNQHTSFNKEQKSMLMNENDPLLDEKIVNLTDSPDLDKIAQGVGSITLSDLKLDLRRLIFGAIPLLKHITPGGPLVLEPFTVTIDGSFSREDIMDSFLLDAGLRRLVAMALRRRVGSLRDFLEGALFHGRSWKLNSESGPSVFVPKLTNVEFDSQNRLIITGRARVQSNKDAPVIENAFKVRTKIGTRKDGKVIRLVEPELALVLECPKSFEENLSKICSALDLPQPPRPKPIYSFFPIYSPFKVDDNDGFDLGEDNCINSIYIQDGALRFQLSAVLRPGRFLGSHYIAFTVPIRTFIVTLDRVREGMRAARQAKNAAKDGKVAKREKARTKIEQAIDAEISRTNDRNLSKRVQPPKSFFSRFVDGYLQAERDFSEKTLLTQAIRDFFGSQGAVPSEGFPRNETNSTAIPQTSNGNETETT